MAEIAPFRGLRYNQEMIPDLAQVVIPPYDVISPEEQKIFHEKNPYNMIRLELGLPTPEDTRENDPHVRAAAFLKQWVRQGVLVRNPHPALYYYELDYPNGPGIQKTRKGFICLLRLEDFSAGGVRPHERTFQAIKDERLGLMLACDSNLSPVFALYPDHEGNVRDILEAGRGSGPAISFRNGAGMEHRVWPVTNRQTIDGVRALMKDKAIFIADGHHRYETGLNYRNLMRNRFGGRNPHASYEYIMVYLSDMDQGGLTILPTHRLLKNLGARDSGRFLEKAASFFEIHRFDPAGEGERAWKDAIEAGGQRKETAIGFSCKGAREACVLTAKRDRVHAWLEEKGLPAPLRTLDVVVLDQIVLRNLMELSDEFLANERNISFMHDFSAGCEAVKSGKYDAGFFINPTRIEQVREVASAGLIMPHKSTYFYPKVISGLVINPLSPGEEII